MIDYLDGQCDRTTMIARIKTHTRRFAKRQGNWFRSLSECRFLDIHGACNAAAVAEDIMRQCPTAGSPKV